MALPVLITVDTEFWPRAATWPQIRLPRPWCECVQEYERCVIGRAVTGDFGLPYLLQSLAAHDLKGMFFVESLFASAFDSSLLDFTVQTIQAANQEVQLHVHTEWLAEIAGGLGLPTDYRQNLGDFSVEQQTAILVQALTNLRVAGARNTVAVRAGNMGGNQDTPIAAGRVGLDLDFSIDPAHGKAARAALAEIRRRSQVGTGCPTIALSCLEIFPGRLRHVQLGAISIAEMEHALLTAAREQWDYFVILLHSFELVRRPKRDGTIHMHRVNMERWNWLCGFLARNRARFETVGCEALKCEQSALRYSRSRASHTLLRMGEQLYSWFA